MKNTLLNQRFLILAALAASLPLANSANAQDPAAPAAPPETVAEKTTLPLLAEEAKQQLLVVEAPETWKVNLYGADRKGMEFYILESKATPTNKEGDTAQLMLTRSWLREVKQIPEKLEAQAKALIEKAKGDKDSKLKTEKYNLEEIAGDTFSGSIVQFEIEGESTQTIFMIGDEEGIWTGQFKGTKERWTEAVSILKKLKKKD